MYWEGIKIRHEQVIFINRNLLPAENISATAAQRFAKR